MNLIPDQRFLFLLHRFRFCSGKRVDQASLLNIRVSHRHGSLEAFVIQYSLRLNELLGFEAKRLDKYLVF